MLVDLYAVVRQGMQVGEESYSLKKLERHHGFVRLEKRVREGGGSIVAYETWLETGDDELLEAIRAYNEEDCRSTLSLRDWLLDPMRPEAEAEFGVDFDDCASPSPRSEHGHRRWMPDVQALIERADSTGWPAHGDERHAGPGRAPPARAPAALPLPRGQARRGGATSTCAASRWTSCSTTATPSPASCATRAGRPMPFKRSLDYAFTFPPQEFRLDTGDAEDPTTGESYNVVAVDEDHVVLRRGNTKAAAGAGRARGEQRRSTLASCARR